MAYTGRRSQVDTVEKTSRFISSRIPYTDGCWSWYTNPNAIYYNGNTYVGYISSAGDVMIAKYNHTSKTTTTFNLHSALQVDDHDNPSILIKPDGKIIAFYCQHTGANMFYRISTSAEDISAWGAEATISGISNCAYPKPIQLSSESNRIYLFYRFLESGLHYPQKYVTSDDGGATWSGETNMIDNAAQRPYVKITSNNTDTIHFVSTDGHPNETVNNSIYHCYYRSGSFYKTDGTLISAIAGLPMLPSAGTKVYDSVVSGIKAWDWDIQLDSSGKPVIAYSNFPSATDHRYRYARWNGSSWIDNEITNGGPYLYAAEQYYSGGMCLDSIDPSIVYLSKKHNKREIFKCTTYDNGVNWKAEAITLESINDNCRPVSVINHVPELPILWWNGTYTTYTSYSTKIISTL